MSGTSAATHAGYPNSTLTLVRNTATIQIRSDGNGKIRMGTLTQLPGGANLELIGDGFDEHTARVAWEGSSYYIFLEEADARPRSMAQYAG